MVSITHVHGYLTDCDSTTGWQEGGGLGANGAFTVVNGDYFDVENTGGAVDYYIENTTNISISTTTYPLILWRYKVYSGSVKAQIIVEFSDASTQTVLAETTSSTFAVGSTTLTAAKTLDHIRFYGNDAVGHVYYDFALVCVSQFNIPNQLHMRLDPAPRDAVIPIPSKVTDDIQRLGSQSAELRMTCDLDQNTWTRSGDTINGEIFLDILHNAYDEPWQWLNTGSHQFKATLHPIFYWDKTGEKVSNTVELLFREFSLGDKSLETYEERFGIGL